MLPATKAVKNSGGSSERRTARKLLRPFSDTERARMTVERIPAQKTVWKAYDAHCDFCETCARYEQGDHTDPCYVGQVLWSCFYGIGYPASLTRLPSVGK